MILSRNNNKYSTYKGNDVDGDYQNDTRRYFVELPSVNGNRGGPAGTKKPGSQGQQAVGSLKLNMSIQDIMRKVTNRIASDDGYPPVRGPGGFAKTPKPQGRLVAPSNGPPYGLKTPPTSEPLDSQPSAPIYPRASLPMSQSSIYDPFVDANVGSAGDASNPYFPSSVKMSIAQNGGRSSVNLAYGEKSSANVSKAGARNGKRVEEKLLAREYGYDTRTVMAAGGKSALPGAAAAAALNLPIGATIKKKTQYATQIYAQGPGSTAMRNAQGGLPSRQTSYAVHAEQSKATNMYTTTGKVSPVAAAAVALLPRAREGPAPWHMSPGTTEATSGLRPNKSTAWGGREDSPPSSSPRSMGAFGRSTVVASEPLQAQRFTIEGHNPTAQHQLAASFNGAGSPGGAKARAVPAPKPAPTSPLHHTTVSYVHAPDMEVVGEARGGGGHYNHTFPATTAATRQLHLDGKGASLQLSPISKASGPKPTESVDLSLVPMRSEPSVAPPAVHIVNHGSTRDVGVTVDDEDDGYDGGRVIHVQPSAARVVEDEEVVVASTAVPAARAPPLQAFSSAAMAVDEDESPPTHLAMESSVIEEVLPPQAQAPHSAVEALDARGDMSVTSIDQDAYKEETFEEEEEDEREGGMSGSDHVAIGSPGQQRSASYASRSKSGMSGSLAAASEGGGGLVPSGDDEGTYYDDDEDDEEDGDAWETGTQPADDSYESEGAVETVVQKSVMNSGPQMDPQSAEELARLHAKYEVVNVVGEGAYGLVMRCGEKTSGRQVAIKEFKINDKDPDAEDVRRTARREVKLLRELQHPNVVQYLEDFTVGGRTFIVMEFVPRSVLELLQAVPGESGLPRQQVKSLLYQLIQAITFMHSKGVLYRDIKPENLLVEDDGTLKLCDFGFARYVSGPDDILTDYVATRWYRAPELLLGPPFWQDGKQVRPPYSQPVDLWAVGCLMGELMDGQPLFPGDSDLDQLYRIVQMMGPLPREQVELFKLNPSNEGIEVPVSEPQTIADRYRHSMNALEVDLMMRLLELDPTKRISGEECLQHPYFEDVRNSATGGRVPLAAASGASGARAMSA